MIVIACSLLVFKLSDTRWKLAQCDLTFPDPSVFLMVYGNYP